MQAVLLLLHRALMSSLRKFKLIKIIRAHIVLQYFLSFPAAHAPLYQLDWHHPATFCSASHPLASSGEHPQSMFYVGRRLPSVG